MKGEPSGPPSSPAPRRLALFLLAGAFGITGAAGALSPAPVLSFAFAGAGAEIPPSGSVIPLAGAGIPPSALAIRFAGAGIPPSASALPLSGEEARDVPGFEGAARGHAPFPDGPPARLTGGFGEDSCYACHWEGTENEEGGALRIDGFPEHFEPGRTYPLAIELERAGMAVAGFQLAIRHADDTTQAGKLAVPGEEEARVTRIVERDIQFVQHRLDGIEPTGDGETRWTVLWTAPASGAGIILHASAVAGDGDQSQMGDFVYTIELEARPRR